MYDKNRKLVDILRNRHSQTIKNIINEFEIQPQVVVMDMFKPFRSVINSNIVQAQIVAISCNKTRDMGIKRFKSRII